MESVPAAGKAYVNVALPRVGVALPKVFDPFRKDTAPVMVPEYCAVTVAVNVTVWLNEDGFGVEVRVVVVVD
jgi:hypothetical protein